MKIAVFATGWNGEYLRDMYHGLENSQKEFHDSIHLYASFGRLGSGDSFNKSEFDFFELADMEAYDGFLYPSTTIKEGDVKQRLLERIIESKKPCISLEEEIPGLSFVGINQSKAMRQIVRHLAGVHGIRTFGFINGMKDTYEAQMRQQGVESKIRELGLCLMPEWVDYLKVRGSFSSVGNPYPRFLTYPTYSYDATNMDWKSQKNFPIGKLYPERTDSWEIGLDAALFKDFKLSGSFYNANTYNQTFDPELPVSARYDKLYVQTGYVRNYGFEAMLAYNHRWGDFGWDTSFTYSTNKNEIVELVRNYVHPETGVIYNVDKLELKTNEGRGFGKAKFILKEGGTLGDLYTHADLKRDINGNVLIDDDGNVTAVDNAGDIKLGSVLPKANLAWNNSFTYKGINAGFLVTARLGGIVYSATQAYLDLYGVSETSAAARDAGGVWVNDRSQVNPQSFYSVVASQSGLPTYYTYSATNVRLQEAHIGYTIPRRWLGNVCDINVSLVGRNLWMIYCKAPFDPEAVATTNNYYQGIDYFMMPSTRNIGFNVKINF